MRQFTLTAIASLFAASAFAAPAASPLSGQFVRSELGNFDAGRQAGYSSSLRQSVESSRSRFGLRSEYDAHLGATFLWASKGQDQATLRTDLTGPALIEARGRHFLARNATVLGLTARGIAEARIFDRHDTGEGPLIARFQQQVGQIEVYGRELNVMTDRNGRLVAISGYFVPNVDGSTLRTAAFSLSPSKAIVQAFRDLGGEVADSFVAGASEGAFRHYQRPAGSGDLRLEADPRVKKVYFGRGNELVPAYYIELAAATRDAARQANFGYVVSAVDGSVLFRKDQTDHATPFNYRMLAVPGDRPLDSPLGNARAPFPSNSPTDEFPRVPATAKLITLSASSAISTADPWLADSATTLNGNNVNAYLDLFAPNGYTPATDVQPGLTGAQTFDYPLVADVDPATADARNSAAVNLFYMNNYLHDLWYDRGFNESARNAQVDNFGRGGVGKDPILAEGQDYSGRNNANMATPSDGASPRMQMYVWDGLVKGEVTITAPADLAGSLAFGTAAFGPKVYDVTKKLVLVDDGTDPRSDACSAPVNGAALAGKFALIDRGNCSFVVKVKFAQDAGAVGVVIANNVAGSPVPMGGTDSTIKIPSVMISLDDGNKIKASPSPVTIHLRRDPATDLDGTIDEGIVAHEFFHYVSNRLVGNAGGLFNTQGGGMGEGWSDFNTMVIQVRASDVEAPTNTHWEGAYPVGAYVTGDDYFGIRRAPYSTDFAKNSLTFKHIENGVALPTTAPLAYGQDGANNAEVHNTGEIWCNILWEGYAGFLADKRYTPSQARKRVMNYVIAGLKLTPNAPTLVEARNGILAAADATNDKDFTIWATAFAKRGMGVGAVAPDRNSTTNSGVIESYVIATPTP